VAYFKPLGSSTPNKAMARFHGLIWVLIYGGLLTLVLGFSVAQIDDDTAWSLMVGGGVVAAIGVVLVVVRSRMKVN
jgi:formate hydrogenlyase subunit 3/multisubunit Na+/H+ antiporter MnhD subunit